MSRSRLDHMDGRSSNREESCFSSWPVPAVINHSTRAGLAPNYADMSNSSASAEYTSFYTNQYCTLRRGNFSSQQPCLQDGAAELYSANQMNSNGNISNRYLWQQQERSQFLSYNTEYSLTENNTNSVTHSDHHHHHHRHHHSHDYCYNSNVPKMCQNNDRSVLNHSVNHINHANYCTDNSHSANGDIIVAASSSSSYNCYRRCKSLRGPDNLIMTSTGWIVTTIIMVLLLLLPLVMPDTLPSLPLELLLLPVGILLLLLGEAVLRPSILTSLGDRC